MAIPKRALAVIAEDLAQLFASSPMSVKSKGSLLEPDVPSLWRGLRSSSQFEVDDAENLVLKPARNFSGRTTGISFTDAEDTAWFYARRQPETPVPNPDGIVVRIRRNLFEDPIEDAFGYSNAYAETNKPRLKYEGMDGEHAFYTEQPFVVPKGSWEAKLPDKNILEEAKRRITKQVSSLFEIDDKKFMRRYGDERGRQELEEHTGSVDFFGFNLKEWRHEAAKNSDPVEQFIFHLSNGEPGLFFELALRAKIYSRPKKERDAYIRLLSQYADESEVAMLYGPDWFYQESKRAPIL